MLEVGPDRRVKKTVGRSEMLKRPAHRGWEETHRWMNGQVMGQTILCPTRHEVRICLLFL
jgi:hypothetical protein